MADNQHSIATYVSDMLALERHILVPFETQLKDEDFKDYADTSRLLSSLCDTAKAHIGGLSAELQRLGGHEISPLKGAVLTLEGFIAGAIDKIRKTKVSKALRDDYTALALCTASYTLLTASAKAMRDDAVATLAERHLSDYAQLVMQIGEALPAVVVEELESIGLDVETGTIEQSVLVTQQAWRPKALTV